LGIYIRYCARSYYENDSVTMFYAILDERRVALLPILKNFQDRFYLAGGTSLALQLGHRDSIDFDFFTQEAIDTGKLFEELREVFVGHEILKTQEEKNTLTLVVDGSVKLSFFTHTYPLIRDSIRDEYLTLASLEDIACMKLSAITGRATNKDYVDLYFLLEKFSLQDLLSFAEEKYPELDTNLLLKSLVYFDDVVEEKILFKNNKEVTFNDVKKRLGREVKAFVDL